MERVDKPGVDEEESYVYYNSPGILTSQDCKTYHAEVCYGWGAAQPLVLDFAISINLDSVPLDDRAYPEGHICDKCLMHMPYGTVAIAADGLGNAAYNRLICISCAQDSEISRWYHQPWEIDLSLVRTALLLTTKDSVGSGNVTIAAGMANTLTFKLTGHGPAGNVEYCFLSLPNDRLESFVREIDRYMGDGDLAAVEGAFLDSGLDMLEAFANGELS